MRPLFRVDPRLPASAFKTFGISQPVETHFRTGTCAEAGCAAQEHGWKTVVDMSTELGQTQSHYIERMSGRIWKRETGPGSLVTYFFTAGQDCFASHRISLQRDPVFFIRGGDWRGDPTGQRPARQDADQWVDTFAEHQDRLNTFRERG